MTRRYVLTGAPGAGKTAILHELRSRGYAVVGEAATDVIAREQSRCHEEPWRTPAFLDQIVAVQRRRQRRAHGRIQFYDRSPVCTVALAHYAGLPVTTRLAAEVERIVREQVYQREVFFVRPLGFVTPTAARRITYEQSLEFEAWHERTYQDLGFDLIDIPPDPGTRGHDRGAGRPESRHDTVTGWAATARNATGWR